MFFRLRQRLNARLFGRHIDDDETLICIVHKHWLLGCKVLMGPLVLLLCSWIFLYSVPFRAVFLGIAIIDTVLLVWLLRIFFDYYLDAWMITDQGVIDVAWHGWFHRQSTRVLYSDIQGVSYEIQGIWSTLLRFGTLTIEKISSGSSITLDYVAKPRRIESIILQNMERYLHTKNMKDSSHVQDILATIVAREVQLNALKH